MVKGCHLDRRTRQQLYYFFGELQKSVAVVFLELFHNDSNEISVSHLEKLEKFFRSSSFEEVHHYINAEPTRQSGRKRIYDAPATAMLLGFSKSDNTKNVDHLHQKMVREWFGHENAPNKRSTNRALKKGDEKPLSNKVITQISRLEDPVKVALYYKQVRIIFFFREL